MVTVQGGQGGRGRLGGVDWGGVGWGMETSPIASEQVRAWQHPQEAGFHWGGAQDHDSGLVIG